jgi:hypothetical protein
VSAGKVLVKAYVPAGVKAELRDECERTGESESAFTTAALQSYLQWRRALAAGGAKHGH